MIDKIHILSLGAGVQSSTLALMAAAGEVVPMPVAAVFADTQAEPESVYKWLDWLETQLPYPVIRVTKGDLTNAALTIREKKDGTGSWSKSMMPTFIKNKDGSRGLLKRQCTYDYKMLPLIRQSLKLRKENGAIGVVQWIGISYDESSRMKQSRDERIIHRWPLIELRMGRYECLEWMKRMEYPQPPRSACVYCPFHSNREWRRMKDHDPKEWARAVQFERDLQEVKKQTDRKGGVPFLHRSLIPLDQVDLSTDVERGQLLLYNECEGMCGV